MVLEKTHKVTLINDNINSYEFVMACLIRYCDHDVIQAEQCALIAHNKGKTDIASGSFNEMYEILETLNHIKVEASLEKYESNLY